MPDAIETWEPAHGETIHLLAYDSKDKPVGSMVYSFTRAGEELTVQRTTQLRISKFVLIEDCNIPLEYSCQAAAAAPRVGAGV